MRPKTLEDATLTRDDKLALGRIAAKEIIGWLWCEYRFGAAWLYRMEEAGYLAVSRPVHAETGIPWSDEHWSVEASPRIVDWFDCNGDLHD